MHIYSLLTCCCFLVGARKKLEEEKSDLSDIDKMLLGQRYKLINFDKAINFSMPEHRSVYRSISFYRTSVSV